MYGKFNIEKGWEEQNGAGGFRGTHRKYNNSNTPTPTLYYRIPHSTYPVYLPIPTTHYMYTYTYIIHRFKLFSKWL